MAKAKQLDVIAERALAAVVANRPDLANWIKDKHSELAGQPRIEVLRWLVFSLDRGNKVAVERAFGFEPGDLAIEGPVARVLRGVA